MRGKNPPRNTYDLPDEQFFQKRIFVRISVQKSRAGKAQAYPPLYFIKGGHISFCPPYQLRLVANSCLADIVPANHRHKNLKYLIGIQDIVGVEGLFYCPHIIQCNRIYDF